MTVRTTAPITGPDSNQAESMMNPTTNRRMAVHSVIPLLWKSCRVRERAITTSLAGRPRKRRRAALLRRLEVGGHSRRGGYGGQHGVAHSLVTTTANDNLASVGRRCALNRKHGGPPDQ